MIPKLLFLLSKTTSNAAVLKTFQLFHTTMTQTRCGGVVTWHLREWIVERRPLNQLEMSGFIVWNWIGVCSYCARVHRCLCRVEHTHQLQWAYTSWEEREWRMPTISYSGPSCMSQKRVNLLAEWWVLTIQPRHVGGGGGGGGGGGV